MPTRVFGLRAGLAVALLCALGAAGCGGKKQAAPIPNVPAFRFAGVDLEFALERIVGESGWVLCLDLAVPKDKTPDLSLIRVDMDLPAGTLDETLRRLRDAFGLYSYSLEDGVVYVRSNELTKDKTALDQPFMNGGKFHGELAELIRFIMVEHPTAFINLQQIAGGFAGPPTEFEIPKGASVKDTLVLYSRAAKAGWQIRRSADWTRDAAGKPAIMGTTIEPRPARKTSSRVPLAHNVLSAVSALADAAQRMSLPFVVYDRSVLQDTRGALNFVINKDPQFPVEKTLSALGNSGFGPTEWHFHYVEEDGVWVLRTSHFLYFLRGRDFLSAPLLAGEFEGSLPELARFINTHQKSPNGEVLMGGEIVDGLAKGKIRVEPGETVHQALVAFAKASGVSPYVVVLDMQNPFSGAMLDRPGVWRGAYLQDLQEWHTQPGDERVLGFHD
ncbi:MAG TPA: hypothetical protein VMR86_20750 [Myxococcota bacterium]|nr:hypothetical protein [Myxococcota bacterium]